MTKAEPQSPGTSRQVAARAIARWLQTGDFPDRLIESVARDRAFVMETVYGVVRQFRALDFLCELLVPRAPKPALHACLLLGLYQLLFMDDQQDFATVHATVEAAKAEAGPQKAGLVNAVLRRVQRERAELQQALARAPLAVRMSHPDVLFDRWTAAFGQDTARHLCEWNNSRPETVLRLNSLRADMDTFTRALRDAGIETHPHPFAVESCLVVGRGVKLTDLPGFREGWFFAQDPSAAVAALLLAPKPGERVLDACAAPGGKTVVLAEQMHGQGELVAMELHEDRIVRLLENAERLQLANVRIVKGDASQWPSTPDELQLAGEGFDRILLDVPCTNTGVIRRRPDARWRFSPERLAKLNAVQRAILDRAAGLVKPGGVIVYSTCSLEPEENLGMVNSWLAGHPLFSLEEQRLLLPPETSTDGAFAARLRKAVR